MITLETAIQQGFWRAFQSGEAPYVAPSDVQDNLYAGRENSPLMRAIAGIYNPKGNIHQRTNEEQTPDFSSMRIPLF